ncbi:hypothetical protein ACFOHS_06070 [Jhaorihella thermophila]
MRPAGSTTTRASPRPAGSPRAAADDALRIIAEQFRDELRRGRQVVFTDDGVEIRRA